MRDVQGVLISVSGQYETGMMPQTVFTVCIAQPGGRGHLELGANCVGQQQRGRVDGLLSKAPLCDAKRAVLKGGRRCGKPRKNRNLIQVSNLNFDFIFNFK